MKHKNIYNTIDELSLKYNMPTIDNINYVTIILKSLKTENVNNLELGNSNIIQLGYIG